MRKYLPLFFALCLFSLLNPAAALAYEDRVLILYDTGATDGSVKFRAYQNTLVSLMGHFKLPTRRKPVGRYNRGDISKYRATFYIGNTSGHRLSKAFLDDALAAKRPIVWMNFNLKQLAQDPKYRKRFESKFAFKYLGPITKPNSLAYVRFEDRVFRRQQERLGKTKVIRTNKAKVYGFATTVNASKQYPYMIRSKNFWYVADNPLEVWYEDQSYIAFAEVLHTVLNLRHSVNHRALVRIENINATDDPVKLRHIADYFKSANVPFSFIVVSRFTDPLAAHGPAQTIDINEAPEVVSALNYMKSKGGLMLMHGFTHQYDSVENPFTGATPDDVELYISRFMGGSIVPVSTIPGESEAWVQNRIGSSLSVLRAAGLPRPRIWVTPNYQASPKAYRVLSRNFDALNERAPDAYFPYLIHRDINGNRIIPENLGFIQPGNVSPQDIIARARKNIVVRDGFASFFFHPDFDIGLLRQAVEGIRAQGYRFVNIDSMI